jgi:hypothetical protein
VCVKIVQYIQKRDPSYAVLKEDTVWNMEKFNNYFNENIAPTRNLAPDWVYTTLTVKVLATFDEMLLEVCVGVGY